MKPVKILALHLLAMFIMSGCSSIRPQITSDAIDFNRAVENTNNQIAFLNIIRSYERHPRHYTAISDIKGNFTVGASSEIGSSVVLGKSRDYAQDAIGALQNITASKAGNSATPKLGLTYSTNPNYTVAVLESQEFYSGILKPIDPSTLSLLRQQGWDEELLVHLFVENFDIEIKDKINVIRNKEQVEHEVSLVVTIDNDFREQGWRELAKKLKLRAEPGKASESLVLASEELEASGIAKLYEQGLQVKPCTETLNKKFIAQRNETDANGNENTEPLCISGSDYVVTKKQPSAIGLKVVRNKGLTACAKEYIYENFKNGKPKRHYIKDCSENSYKNDLALLEQPTLDLDTLAKAYKEKHKDRYLDDEDKEKKLDAEADADIYQKINLAVLARYLDNCVEAPREFLFTNKGSANAEALGIQQKLPDVCKSKVHMGTRSPDGVIYYIGEYARRLDTLEKNDGKQKKADMRVMLGSRPDPMFVLEAQPEEGAALGAQFQGKNYYIPKGKPGGRSMQIIALAQQLLNLHKKAEDLPKAQLIQIQ